MEISNDYHLIVTHCAPTPTFLLLNYLTSKTSALALGKPPTYLPKISWLLLSHPSSFTSLIKKANRNAAESNQPNRNQIKPGQARSIITHPPSLL
ncbi:hypothetical protein VTJ04DRAFT_10739 [Mycothermus thermophilus]|uniref:uncharacterized protein n=1 Tax=Humicola insolens TaxID=85995 RepID=UPI003744117A